MVRTGGIAWVSERDVSKETKILMVKLSAGRSGDPPRFQYLNRVLSWYLLLLSLWLQQVWSATPPMCVLGGGNEELRLLGRGDKLWLCCHKACETSHLCPSLMHRIHFFAHLE